jgi:hypothetical protein
MYGGGATRIHVPIRSGIYGSDLRISWVKKFGFEKENRIQIHNKSSKYF